MAKQTGKEPQVLPDEALDEAAGGLSLNAGAGNDAAFMGGVFVGVRVAVGDVNNDGTALKKADGSVKPGA